MDEITLIAIAACAILTFLVWLMWKAATKDEWAELAHNEKKRWRMEEEKRKEKAG